MAYSKYVDWSTLAIWAAPKTQSTEALVHRQPNMSTTGIASTRTSPDPSNLRTMRAMHAMQSLENRLSTHHEEISLESLEKHPLAIIIFQ